METAVSERSSAHVRLVPFSRLTASIDTHGRITLFPASTAPTFPFSFSLTHSSVLRATTINTWPQSHGISTPPIHSLALFPSIFTDISYTFSCSSGATTTRIPIPLQHRSFLTPVLDYAVGTLAVFKLPPFKDGISIRS
jgi:hypothetical protein